jgi:hypothetical protein
LIIRSTAAHGAIVAIAGPLIIRSTDGGPGVWLTKPRAELKRKMAKGVSKN